MSAESNSIRREIAEQLSFALYVAASRMARMHKPFLEPLGLTFPQYLVMVELLGDSPRPVGELGSKVGMDTGTITPLLKRLERDGLITRQRDVRDERRVLVDLTPSGAALRDGIWAVPDQIKSACRLTDASADELRRAIDALARPAAG
jgi:DNA-binding MarR family transcriptional regulator